MFQAAFLVARMGLYAAFAALAGAEIGTWNSATGDFAVNAGDLAEVLAYAAAYVGTFFASRFAKVK